MNVEPFHLPLSTPLSTAAGTIEEREGFLIRVDSEDTGIDERDADGPAIDDPGVGKPGVGEATPLTGWTESHETCRAALDRAADVLAEDGPREALAEIDDAPAARHGLALALADARAGSRNEPLYQTLGADGRIERVPVNATIGDGSPEETAERVMDAVERGFSCLKLKVGARPVPEDLERVRAVRDAVGDGVELRLDANGAWVRAEAEQALDGLVGLGVSYVEQPLSADDLAGHTELRRHTTESALDGTTGSTEGGSGDSEGRVRIALDESVAEVGIDPILRRNVADVVILKPMVLGGPDRAVAAARRARRMGATPVVTTTVDGVYARTGAIHVAASIQAGFAADGGSPPACGLATADLLAEDLADDPAPVEDGKIRVPQNPGLGVDPDA